MAVRLSCFGNGTSVLSVVVLFLTLYSGLGSEIKTIHSVFLNERSHADPPGLSAGASVSEELSESEVCAGARKISRGLPLSGESATAPRARCKRLPAVEI